MNKLTIFILMSFIIFGCTENGKKVEKKNFPVLTDKYLNQEKPELESKMFAPGIISTGKYELNAVFSPDYSEFYYSIRVILSDQIVIMCMKYIDNQWTKPEVVSFSGKYSDADPFITNDNKWMYFISMRPVDDSNEPKDYDIWRTKRVENGWGEPEHLDTTVNSKFTDVYPTLTKDGTLYFSSGRDNASHGRDIFYSRMNGDSFEQAVRLEGAVNDYSEGDVFISPNEDYLIISRQGKGLVISFKTEGNWSEPIDMGEQINLTGYEYCPIVSPDGKFLFFTSRKNNFKSYSDKKMSVIDINNRYDSLLLKPQNGLGDIYWISTEVIDKIKAEN